MTIATKTLRAPFTPDALRSLAQQYGTPLWLYDSEVIVSRIARLNHFDVIRFAQKANSNIHILRLMHEHGVKVDSVSAGEIERALKAGYRPDEIVFTADMINAGSCAGTRHCGEYRLGGYAAPDWCPSSGTSGVAAH